MLITFSHPLDRAASYVESSARKYGVEASIGHVRPHPGGLGTEVRFTLWRQAHESTQPGIVRPRYLTASPEQHDAVILQLLHLDPQAKVRTARAVYDGLADFEAQHAARVP